MGFFSYFKYKLIVSVVIAVISSFYQLENEEDLEISTKVVLLHNSRHKVYEFLINFEEYKTVRIFEWINANLEKKFDFAF